MACLATTLRLLSRNRSKCSLLGPVFATPTAARHLRIKRDAKIRPHDRTLAEVLSDMNVIEDEELHRPINIGFASPYKKVASSQQKEEIAKIKQNKELQAIAREGNLVASLEDINKTWLTTSGAVDIGKIATHYGIFRDLFDDAYFYPWIPMNILYDYDDKFVTPVYRGNHVKPSEAASAPHVNFKSKPDSLWTLILTNPDCHFEDPNAEYLHWFVTNIPGNDVAKGTAICDYLPPFPARGTGYQRFVFVLFKQEKKLDFSSLQRTIPCTSLKERTFRMVDFYRANQDDLTPAGLAFFQSDWDHFVTDVFHNVLDMQEPTFEYELEEKPMEPQKWNPNRNPGQLFEVYEPWDANKVPFDDYLDQHNDPKVIAAQVLQLRLKRLDPFEQEPPLPEHPIANPMFDGKDLRTWERKQLRRQMLRSGKYRDL